VIIRGDLEKEIEQAVLIAEKTDYFYF